MCGYFGRVAASVSNLTCMINETRLSVVVLLGGARTVSVGDGRVLIGGIRSTFINATFTGDCSWTVRALKNKDPGIVTLHRG
jgi:hypothetical protein